MSSNYRLIESGEARVNNTSIYCLGSWEGCSDTFATTRGLRWALKVSDIRGYTSIPGVEGPNRAHIVSDKYDLLSRLLFLDTQVKLVSSFDWAWWAGEDSSSDCLEQLPKENFMPPGWDASTIRLKVVCQLWVCRLWEGLAVDLKIGPIGLRIIHLKIIFNGI